MRRPRRHKETQGDIRRHKEIRGDAWRSKETKLVRDLGEKIISAET
jgi:hypothetical protein